MNYIDSFKDVINFGGEGSGNWGHEGRPGEVGGSGEGGEESDTKGEGREHKLAMAKRSGSVKSTQSSADKKEEKRLYSILKDSTKPMAERQAAHDKIMELKATKEKLEKAQLEKAKEETMKELKQKTEWHQNTSTEIPANSVSAQFSDKASKMNIDDIHNSLAEKNVINNLKEATEKGLLDIKSAQEIHASIDHTISDFGNEKFNSAIKEINVYPVDNGFAEYNSDTKILGFDSNSKNIISDLKYSTEKTESNYYVPFHPTASIKAIMDHEIAHAFTWNKFDDIAKMAVGSSDINLGIGQLVSNYATQNKDEFLAETFEAGRNGINLNEKIQPYYNAIIDYIKK